MIKIPVKISGLERRRRSIGLMHAVAGFFLLANVSATYKVLTGNSMWAVAAFFVLAFGAIAYGFLRGRLDPASRYNTALRWVQAVAFLVLGIICINNGMSGKSLGLLIWAALSLMLAFTERVALKNPEVELNEQGISFPNGFSSKAISWKEIEDLTLRPDFLTLHFPENRFLQFELKDALDYTASQKVQDFCRRHLGKALAG